jgi:hypothetical protein
MKRSRRARSGTGRSNLTMPHERDESTHAPDEPRNVTSQAARDVESGQRDTDCYGAAGDHFDGVERTPKY